MKRKAFTLVELLVVIGIIALLISILLPALSKAREQANRIKCAANLRTLGQVCVFFANDHKGIFPSAWGYGQQATQNNAVCFSVLLNYNPANDDDTDTWRRFGSSYQGLLRYAPAGNGADVFYTDVATSMTGTVKLANWLTCPSTYGNIANNYQAWANNGGYGWAIQTSYMYVAGVQARTIGSYSKFIPGGITHLSGYNWGNLPPAVRLSDRGSTNVLAADTVWWGGGGAQGNGYVINHPDRSDAKRPAFANLLYSDGHVEGSTPVYTDSVTHVASNQLTANSWSIAHEASGAFQGHYFYWGQ